MPVCIGRHSTVALADEARTSVKEEVRSGFLDRLHQFTVSSTK